MATTGEAKALAKGLARIFGPGTAAGLEDGRLIERFVASGDASAFEAIVGRHGPMVWGVCRRSLADPNDAEDAFQATFLILARRAGAIRDPGRLGGWLHGVARKVAVRARRDAARRPSFEADELADAGPGVGQALEQRERAELLHGEIERLPDRYRHPIVLCHLEGCTHEEAAERLGWPVGTVRGNLSRGRDRLRDGLSRRGLASFAFPPNLPHFPPALAGDTARAASALAAGRTAAGLASARSVAWLEGVSRTMTTSELKSIALKSLVVALAATTGVGAYALSRGEAPPPAPAPLPPPAKPDAPKGPLALPAGWGGGGEGYELGIDEAVKHSGQSSGCVRATDEPGPFGTLTQGFQAAAYRGKRVTLSSYIKVEGVENRAALWMRVDGRGKALAFDNMGERPIKGTLDWKKYEITLDVPSGAEEVYFGMLLAGKGTAWVDDLSFDVVGKAAAPGGAGPEAGSLPAGPGNLGFEKKAGDAPAARLEAGSLPAGPGNLGFEKKAGDAPAAIAPNPSRPRLGPPAGWGGGGQGYDLVRDESVKHSGKSSGSIRSSESPGPFGTYTQGFQAAAYRGKRVRLSAQVKVDGVEDQSGLWMRVDGKETSPLAFDNMGDRPIKGTADWKKYEITLDVPADAEEIYLGFLLSGPGRAWVDEMSLEVVGKDVPATGMEVQPQPRQGGPASGLPAEPRNLGFDR